MELLLHTEMIIDSAHFLKGYIGKCANIHGHTWVCDVYFKGESRLKNKIGILVDFGIVKGLYDVLDHKILNDVIDVNPTAENLVEWVYNELRIVVDKDIKIKIRVHECMIGKDTYCEGGDWI